jgi:predicted metal-dependent peptidase
MAYVDAHHPLQICTSHRKENMSKLPLPLIRAKNQVIMNEAFYAVLMMGMHTVVDDKFPAAMGTDGKAIYVNPKYIEMEKWTQDHMIYAFMHECIHVMSGDMWWAHEYGLDKDLANQAADHWINLTLDAESKIAPANCLHDPKYKGWTKIEIYKDLQKNGGGGKKGKPVPGKGDDPFQGDVIPTPSDPNLKAEIGLRVKAAVQAAKAAGTHIPQWAQDMVTEMAKPKVNWKRRLFHLVQQVVYSRNDYSYGRHNRRYIPHGIIAPTLWSPEPSAGCIVVAVDTSGSISFEELKQFWGEIKEILTSVAPRILWVLDVDTDIRKARSFEPHEDLPDEIQVYGRGGTYFTEPFKWVDDNLRDDMPQMLIYLTDMEGRFPADAPPYPTVWVATTDNTAPWGETIHIDTGRGY